jgi:two-component system sensor histidine kinase RegB
MADLRLGGKSRDDRMLRLDTLVRLRWLAVAGQILAVLVVAFGLGFHMPLAATALVVLLSVLLNIVLLVRFPSNHRFSARTSAFILALDVVQLTALLWLTGGITNPFAMLFLAPVMVSAATLPLRYTVLLGGLVGLLATMLAFYAWPLPWRAGEPIRLEPLYVTGLWLAVLVALSFIAAYTWRVADEARKLSDALAATELVLAREQHLNAVAGLAAAAAHKLGTPLATITVVARELDLQVKPRHPLKSDIVLLRQEAQRCREILTNISALGRDEGGPLMRMGLTQLVEEAVDPHRGSKARITVTAAGEGEEPVIARNPGLIYALGNLVENAVDFATGQVEVEASWNATRVRVRITDDGPGFAPEVMARLGEPYVTSRRNRLEGVPADRGHGGGHGLGLFIAKTLVERSGGRVRWQNRQSGGAEALLIWERAEFSNEIDQKG